MTKIVKPSEIDLAAEILNAGGVIAFPTETVFGLAVSSKNKAAFHRLNEIKNRPPDKPYTLMVASLDDLNGYAVLNEHQKKFANKFMPGPITVLLTTDKACPKHVDLNTGVIGVRIPDNEFILNLIKKSGPLLVPSANRSGEKPLLNSNDVYNIFKDDIDLIIEGSCSINVPSTVVNIINEPIVVRLGSISKEEIDKVWEETR